MLFFNVAKQDCPLRILAFKVPVKRGDYPRLVVQNTSQKKIRGFLVEAVVGPLNRSGSPTDANINHLASVQTPVDSKWPQEQIIAPGESSESHQPVFMASFLVMEAKRLNSTCLQIIPFIVNVEFADGSTWNAKSQFDPKMWSNAPRASGADSCQDSPATMKELEHVKTGGINRNGESTNAGQDAVQSYSVACPLRPIDGKLVALCPF